jgi:hypothetical protein
MKRGVAVLLISIATWLVSLGMVNAKPRDDATHFDEPPAHAAPVPD